MVQSRRNAEERQSSFFFQGVPPFTTQGNNSSKEYLFNPNFRLAFKDLRTAATLIPVYVTGWCGHGFESHSQPFLMTYPEADLTYYF